MKKKVYLLVFDGLADWEPALALCEINRSGLYDVLAAGFSKKIIRTMGGLFVTPQVTLEEIRMDEISLLILPGGDMWKDYTDEKLLERLKDFHKNEIPLAAACGATLEFARAGLLDEVRHTSNSLAYLKEIVPQYQGEKYYQEQLAVRDSNLITASGLGCVEFAREIILQLGIYNLEITKEWFDMFKSGIFPG